MLTYKWYHRWACYDISIPAFQFLAVSGPEKPKKKPPKTQKPRNLETQVPFSGNLSAGLQFHLNICRQIVPFSYIISF